MYKNTSWMGVKNEEPDSSQWYPVTVQEIIGTNWNTRNSFKHEKKVFSGKRSNTGYPERLWSLHPWRHSKANWTQSWAAYWIRQSPAVPANLITDCVTTTEEALLWRKLHFSWEASTSAQGEELVGTVGCWEQKTWDRERSAPYTGPVTEEKRGSSQ